VSIAYLPFCTNQFHHRKTSIIILMHWAARVLLLPLHSDAFFFFFFLIGANASRNATQAALFTRDFFL
jgi:hypothetical protein